MHAYRAKLTPAAAWEPGETGFVVTFPEWGWGVTQGETEAEAPAMAEDALDATIVAQIEAGAELPHPTSGELAPDERLVPVAPQAAAAPALYEAMRSAGVAESELAGRLAVDERRVRRMLEPRRPAKLPELDAALRALGRRLVVGARRGLRGVTAAVLVSSQLRRSTVAAPERPRLPPLSAPHRARSCRRSCG